MLHSPKIINLDFVQVEIHANYLISTIQEGIVFSTAHLETFYTLFETHYPNKKFGYISNRKFDYSVDPTCYKDAVKYPNLLGFAVWCHSEASFNTTQFEKSFNSKPFEGFYTFEECKIWIETLISKN